MPASTGEAFGLHDYGSRLPRCIPERMKGTSAKSSRYFSGQMYKNRRATRCSRLCQRREETSNAMLRRNIPSGDRALNIGITGLCL